MCIVRTYTAADEPEKAAKSLSVRILTQESQKGKPAVELHNTKPNPMINGHQDWLDGLVAAARKVKPA